LGKPPGLKGHKSIVAIVALDVPITRKRMTSAPKWGETIAVRDTEVINAIVIEVDEVRTESTQAHVGFNVRVDDLCTCCWCHRKRDTSSGSICGKALFNGRKGFAHDTARL